MTNSVLIIGQSGTGKSSAIRNLDPKTTFIISVLDKPLPFKGYRKNYIPLKSWDDKKGNYYTSSEWQRILKCIEIVNENRPEINCLVLDDIQYILAHEFMNRSQEKSYDKYTEMANHYWSIISRVHKCRSDLMSVFLSHSDVDNTGRSKIKTIGKLLDEKITIEGLFTIVLHSLALEGEYKFLTQHDGFHTAKSPFAMFEERLISNDLQYVREKILEYEE